MSQFQRNTLRERVNEIQKKMHQASVDYMKEKSNDMNSNVAKTEDTAEHSENVNRAKVGQEAKDVTVTSQ